jgi:hypothetical protein
LKKKLVKNIYLTELSIIGYNTKGRFLGTLSDEAAFRLVYIYDLYYFRDNWLEFKEELKAFGLELTEIKKHEDVK